MIVYSSNIKYQLVSDLHIQHTHCRQAGEQPFRFTAKKHTNTYPCMYPHIHMYVSTSSVALGQCGILILIDKQRN